MAELDEHRFVRSRIRIRQAQQEDAECADGVGESVNAKGHPGFATAITTPASAGPMSWPTEDADALMALARWRLEALVNCGMSPLSAGLEKACPTPRTDANAMTR